MEEAIYKSNNLVTTTQKDQRIIEANRIAQLHGFSHANHLLSAMSKYLGKKYNTVQEIPTEEIIECSQKRLQSKTSL